MRRLTVVAFIALLVFPIAALGGSRGKSRGSSRSYSGSHSSSHSSGSRVHVKGYTKKDGTYVAPHDRSAPRSHSASSLSPSHYPSATSSGHATGARDKNGRLVRSAKARSDFMRQTGYPHGRSGYVVDHIVPLECGGADAPSNMQWQTVAEGKAKDRTEHDCRR